MIIVLHAHTGARLALSLLQGVLNVGLLIASKLVGVVWLLPRCPLILRFLRNVVVSLVEAILSNLLLLLLDDALRPLGAVGGVSQRFPLLDLLVDDCEVAL